MNKNILGKRMMMAGSRAQTQIEKNDHKFSSQRKKDERHEGKVM